MQTDKKQTKKLHTLYTGKGLLYSVISHVSFQMATLFERFVTQSTLIWGFVGVSPHVNVQMAACVQRFVTKCALVWGFFGVSPHVSCQIAACGERFTAYRAAEVLLAVVDSQINRQMLFQLEHFDTVFTCIMSFIAIHSQMLPE